MKRYISEYANDKIKGYKQLSKIYPANKENYLQRIRKAQKIVKYCKAGLITIDESMIELAKL